MDLARNYCTSLLYKICSRLSTLTLTSLPRTSSLTPMSCQGPPHAVGGWSQASILTTSSAWSRKGASIVWGRLIFAYPTWLWTHLLFHSELTEHQPHHTLNRIRSDLVGSCWGQWTWMWVWWRQTRRQRWVSAQSAISIWYCPFY